MNSRIAVPVLLAVLATLPLAFAQVTATSAPADAAVAASRGEAARSSRSSRHATDADARHCLEFPDNLQVILCAEKYRPHGRRATGI